MNQQLIADLALAGVFLLSVAAVIGGLLLRWSVEATIQGFFWQRKVSLECYTWVEKSSYNGYPAGSRNHRSKVEVHQTYQVVSSRTTTTVINGSPVTSTQPVYGFVPHPRKRFFLRNPGVGQE